MEKQLKVLKKALEMGARVKISFHGNGSLDEAKEKAEAIASELGKELEFFNSEDETALYQSFNADYYSSPISISSYYTTYKKEETA